MKIFALITFLFASLCLASQDAYSDVFKKQLSEAGSDSAKIDFLLNSAWKLMEKDAKLALAYSEDALLKAESIKNNKRIAKALINIGFAFYHQSDYVKAIEYHKRANMHSNKYKLQSQLSSSFLALGLDYERLGNFTESMKYAIKASKIYDEGNNKKGLASCYINIGLLNYNFNRDSTAIEYFLKGLEQYLLLKDSFQIALCYDNLSSVNYRIKRYELSLDYALKSLDLKKRTNDSSGIVFCFINIANAYYAKKNYVSSLNYLTSAEKLINGSTDKKVASLIYLNISNSYYYLHDKANASHYLSKGLTLAKENRSVENILLGYSTLAQRFEDEKDFKNAYKYFKLHSEFKDSIFDIEKNKQLSEIQTKFETSQKVNEINELTLRSKELKQENQIQDLKLSKNRYLILILVSIIFIVIVLGYLIISQNKLKAIQAKTEVEQKLFRSQMNPHFIFNSLTAIQNYAFKHPPAEVAGYISRFAKLMRLILENSRNELVNLEKEIDSLKYYLELQQMRFENKFDFNIEVDPKIDVESISIPPMLAQPFIENAIEHGIMNKPDGKGVITIRFIQKEKMIELIVEDNGIGIEASKKLKNDIGSKHTSLATTITEERLSLLNKKSKQKFSFTISDIKDDKGNSIGTHVSIRMPEA